MYIQKQTNSPFPSYLGKPPAAAPKCIPTPSFVTPLKHFHIRKNQKVVLAPTTIGPLTVPLPVSHWDPEPTPSEMMPVTMNPGFLDPSLTNLVLDPTLHPKLTDLMTKFSKSDPPFDVDPFKTFVARGGTIGVALVDLSGKNNSVFTKVAGFRSTAGYYGASLPKILALYAAHQLKFNLNLEAKQNPAAMTAARLTSLRAMFDVSSSLDFEFKPGFKADLEKICGNCEATRVINALDTQFIGSVAWQSGLYDCRRAGLWIGAGYPMVRCPSTATSRADPIHGLVHGASALSAVQFFTLLGQGRLVDDAACASMKRMLVIQKDTSCGSFFQMGLNAGGRPVATDKIFSKIGVVPSVSHCSSVQPCCGKPPIDATTCKCICFIHEGALIERVHGGKPLRYAVAILTKSSPGSKSNQVLMSLITHLDQLIVDNNP